MEDLGQREIYLGLGNVGLIIKGRDDKVLLRVDLLNLNRGRAL